jgi:hypothetical protein
MSAASTLRWPALLPGVAATASSLIRTRRGVDVLPAAKLGQWQHFPTDNFPGDETRPPAMTTTLGRRQTRPASTTFLSAARRLPDRRSDLGEADSTWMGPILTPGRQIRTSGRRIRTSRRRIRTSGRWIRTSGRRILGRRRLACRDSRSRRLRSVVVVSEFLSLPASRSGSERPMDARGTPI